MIETIFSKLLSGQTITEEESYKTFELIMDGNLSSVRAGAFLSLLRVKGEQPSEITGAVKLLRDKAIKVKVNKPVIVDTCGTGGDQSHTFNISTAAAILASAAELCVAKHGNRSVSSKCGSADVMESLGYNIEMHPEKSKELLEKCNFAFFYAPIYHKAMKNVGPVRKELGFRTIFNIIGPLCNPAGTTVQIMGVSDYQLLKTIPIVFQKLGLRGYIFHAEDGLDEISLTGKTYIVETTPEKIEEKEIHPGIFGFKKCGLKELVGGDAKENAEIIRQILQGKEKGAKRDIVVLNTSVLLKASGIAKSFREGIELCNSTLDSGKAYNKLREILEYANK